MHALIASCVRELKVQLFQIHTCYNCHLKQKLLEVPCPPWNVALNDKRENIVLGHGLNIIIKGFLSFFFFQTFEALIKKVGVTCVIACISNQYLSFPLLRFEPKPTHGPCTSSNFPNPHTSLPQRLAEPLEPKPSQGNRIHEEPTISRFLP